MLRIMPRLRHGESFSRFWLLLIVVVTLFATPVQSQSSCAMDIWIFSSIESCQASDAPIANGVLYADGLCHTIETSLSPDQANYALFPGNYRAQCVDGGKIRFSDSACLDAQCTSSSSTDVCDRDDASPASLYSRLDPPEYPVQDPSNASIGALYTCLKLNATDDTSLTFVVFGDCTSCAAPSTAAPVTPAPTPTGTWSPTTLFPTPRWSLPNATTHGPVSSPTTTASPVAPAPVAAPVTAPVIAPVVDNTEAPVTGPTTAVALRLSPMEQIMDTDAQLQLWKNATLQQLNRADVILSNVRQSLVAADNTTTRRLQTLMALHIDFDLTTTTSATSDDALQLFHQAFDTEQERSNYLIKLVPNDAIFASVRLIEVLPLPPSAAPVAAPTQSQTQESGDSESSKIGLFVALGGGVLLIALAIMGMIVYQRRRAPGGSKKEVKTNGETPSDDDDEYALQQHTPPVARWTNEIVVDPSADDVSTLGGSVLIPGVLQLDASAAAEGDEPTASVNLDYDFDRQQYRSADDARSRTVATDGTGRFTHFSKLGMNGALLPHDMEDDDQSFEQQYADLTEEMDDYGRSDMARRVKPFEVRAPPGKLGMVVDTPNGGVPLVRAIKEDSVLRDSICVGDRLISVDHRDVTNMNALEVSSLISLKQHQTRLLIFCRLSPPATPNSQPSPVATNSTSAS